MRVREDGGMSEQLDLLSWTPPKPERKRASRKRSNGDDDRPCGCGKNIGRGHVWRDDAGVDHVECEACLSPPRHPYYRPPPLFYPRSIGEANRRDQQLAEFDAVFGPVEFWK